MIMRVPKFVLCEACSIPYNEAARVHEPCAPQRLGFGSTLRHHGRDHQVGDAGRSFAGAEEKHSLVGEFFAAHTQCREQARERYRGGSLDVVVEDADFVAIFVQEPERRMVGEILVVSGTAQAFLAQADIVWVVQQVVVVGAYIKHHRQAVLRVYAGAGRIKRELAYRNAHAVGT